MTKAQLMSINNNKIPRTKNSDNNVKNGEEPKNNIIILNNQEILCLNYTYILEP